MIIHVRVKPSSSKEEILITGKNNLKVQLKEKPEDNKANIALIKLLARHFGVSSANIKILKGLSSREKVIEIEKSKSC